MATQTKGTGEIRLDQVEDLDGISVLRGGGDARHRRRLAGCGSRQSNRR